MGQILIIQDDGEVGAQLSANHSVARVSEAADLAQALSSQTFQAAVLASGNSPELLKLVQQADPDLAAIVLRNAPSAGESEQAQLNTDPQAWETVQKPFSPETLRAALERATRHTDAMRENRLLRKQKAADASPSASETDGATAAPNLLQLIASLPMRFNLREFLASVEKAVILRTLEATGGAQAEAARRLGLSRSDLSYKLAKYELRRPAAVSSA